MFVSAALDRQAFFIYMEILAKSQRTDFGRQFCCMYSVEYPGNDLGECYDDDIAVHKGVHFAVFAALNIQVIIQVVRYDDDKDLHVQLDVFEEELSADADALEEMSHDGVDMSQPDQLFQALHRKVRSEEGSTATTWGMIITIMLHDDDESGGGQ